MRVLLSTYGSREGVEPMVGPELVASQFDSVAAAAENCDGSVATGLIPTGVWR